MQPAVHPPAMGHQFQSGIPYESSGSRRFDSRMSFSGNTPPLSRSWLITELQKSRVIQHPTLSGTKARHASRTSVDAVHDNIQEHSVGAGQPNMSELVQPNMNAYGQQPMDRTGPQHEGYNGQSLARSRRASHDAGSIAQPRNPGGLSGGFSGAVNLPTRATPIFYHPSRRTIEHPNQIVYPLVDLADDFDTDSSDEEYYPPSPIPVGLSNLSDRVFHFIPMAPSVGTNPMIANQMNPTVAPGDFHRPMAIASGQTPATPYANGTDRPYSYNSFFRPGLQYSSMESHLERLQALINGRKPKLNDFVDIVAQRSPSELDALKYNFNLKFQQDLRVLFDNALSNEDDCIKSTATGLILGPVEFDLWILKQVPTLR